MFMRPSLAFFIAVVLLQPVQAQELTADQLQYFEQKVRPLLVAKCYECHSSQSEKVNGGLKLDSPESLIQGGDNGPVVKAGKPEESLLIKAVHYTEVGFEMPPAGKLKPHEIEVFERWVAMGAPFPATSTNSSSRKEIDIEAGKRHWAFQPLPERVELPQASMDVDASTPWSGAWSSNRLDAFILASQKAHAQQPLAGAPRTQLLRRIKFDLVGLPPTPEELEEFQQDTHPGALERIVDRWLASPRYGERWARHWLELVRYCDVAESWAESQGNSFFYRDWVVNAFNEDMPFDRFSKLQLAADSMADARSQDLAALGFIGLSPTYWKELQLPVEIIKTIVSDEYEERIHTFSSTFFGLNMACARCHDHKFDPITTQDYYALAGVFASTRAADRALAKDVDSIKIYEAHKLVEKCQADIKKLDSEVKKLEAALKPLNERPESELNADQLKQRTDQAKTLSDKQAALAKLNDQIKEAQQTPGYGLPLAPGATDGTLEVLAAVGTHGSRIVYEPKPKDAPIEIRGNPNKTAQVVPRRYVSVLSKEAPKNFTQGSGRLDLAEAMFSESSALIARVWVNRVWKQHFGVGLVDTPSDFGVQSQKPSHPELLEDLAGRFVANGWSTKWLHREIVLSATYQQLCRTQAKDLNHEATRWYVGAPLRRLDVEQWRDAILSATGSLDTTMAGAPIELSVPTNMRRTLYGLVRRRELSDILRLNDVPDPLTHSPSRSSTTTPLQQLFVLNSPFMQQQAEALAARAQREAPGSVEQRIEMVYKSLYGRGPSDEEMKIGQGFVEASPDAWSQYAQVLLGSNEFLFID